MISRYKSTVKFNNQDKFLTDYDRYHRVVDEVLKANQNLDARSQKFMDTISEFPQFKVENKDEKSNIKIEKGILGLTIIEIFISNRKMRFLLDTGAQVSCLSYTSSITVENIRKANKKVEVGSANNNISEMEVALIDEVKIGKTKFFNLPVLILEENQLSFSLFGYKFFQFDGILGWDILSHLDFEIDYKNLEFRIVQSEEEDQIENLITSDFPTVLVIDEKDEIRTFGLDTGARKSWINDKLVEEAGLKILKEKKRKTVGIHGKEMNVVKVIQEYKTSLKDSLITLAKIETGFTGFLNGYELDGVFGSDILKDNIIRVINSKGILQLKMIK